MNAHVQAASSPDNRQGGAWADRTRQTAQRLVTSAVKAIASFSGQRNSSSSLVSECRSCSLSWTQQRMLKAVCDGYKPIFLLRWSGELGHSLFQHCHPGEHRATGLPKHRRQPRVVEGEDLHFAILVAMLSRACKTKGWCLVHKVIGEKPNSSSASK